MFYVSYSFIRIPHAAAAAFLQAKKTPRQAGAFRSAVKPEKYYLPLVEVEAGALEAAAAFLA